ncbi:sensor histidine kinase [Ruminococcus albus]|uniref:histidine kinase n=1 Tax=Ruminococcus albus 8 TaxID=246199 RepID=E9SH16_RUMAL|nr:HAMP domain-containing sensor histidine kinase [Ruminococcus albus]EGC01502.1 ATPase/histidine kinase/DNA gyrase B/HSP90 domain protein [Ruminococcus albus 8]MBE6873374.1 HAMP domain-containing histidine kinase [Ruminococcus albus]MCC3351009.1 HAMP domain-containing histidine kinase [Ruminococcus albus 8]
MKKVKQIKKRSLSFFVISNIILMVLMIIVAVNIEDQITGDLLVEHLKQMYLEEYPDATYQMATDAILRNEFTSEMRDDIVRYNNLYLVIQLVMIVIIITVFSWIILRKVHKELKIFQVALNSISDIDVQDWEVVSINSDIKEFDSICTSYNSMVTKLQESEATRSKLESQRRQLTADISHDLKTPITVIQGYAKALNDGVADPDAERRYLEAICSKTEMVAELINTFHEYSKLEHPRFGFEMENGDICEYFREYLAMKYEELDLAGFELEADLPENSIPLSFDHSQLKRVFENLITNSFRHNQAGTIIYADITDDDNAVVIHIGDNGKGIPEEMRDTIFEPFVVGSRSRTDSKGSGLGLAISKRIVEAHSGSIALKDDPTGRCKTLYEIILKKPAKTENFPEK